VLRSQRFQSLLPRRMGVGFRSRFPDSQREFPKFVPPKPLDCFAIPMRQHVEPGGLCYEPFSGSGSQIMAGQAVGRRVFAMEISPTYVDVAVERWQKATGKSAVLDGDARSFDEIKNERDAA